MLDLSPFKISELKKRYRPAGWKIIHPARIDRELSGKAEPTNRIIMCPRLHDNDQHTTRRFHVFFHECAHVHLGHFKANLPSCLEEWQADRYGFLILMAEGFNVEEMDIENYQHNVGLAIAEDDKAKRRVPEWLRRWVKHKPGVAVLGFVVR